MKMAEHVEREKLLTDICDDMCGLKYTGVCENCRVVALIADAPAANVAPVVHGRWVSVAGKRDRICSRCLHNEPYKNADDDAEVFEFCPHCGAKMDGGANNG
jgi:hypothetical protein